MSDNGTASDQDVLDYLTRQEEAAGDQDAAEYRRGRSFRPKKAAPADAQDAPKHLAEVGEAVDQTACPSLDYHGRTFYFPWRGVVRVLTDVERKRLRAEIKADGVTDAIDVDEFDNVIDGDNRLHIAFELKIPLSELTFTIHEGRTAAWKLRQAFKKNWARRHLTPQEQEQELAEFDERVKAMRKAGKSQREIAEEEGVPKSKVARSAARGGPAGPPDTKGNADANTNHKASGASGKVTGKDGKQYAAQKPAPEAPATCPKNSLLAAVLHYLDDLPLREIAREVEVPEGTFRGHWEKYRPEVEAHVEKERLRREAAAPKDELGRPIPEGRLRDIFDYRELIDNACARQNQNTALVNRLLNETLFNSPQARRISVESRVASQNLYQHLYNPRPFAVCLQCGGRAGSCKDCASTGWMTLDQYREFAGLPSSAPRFETCAECKGKRTKSCKGGCHGTGLVLKAGGGK